MSGAINAKGLTRIASGLTLPFPALPTLACASFGDHLHLLALADPAPRKVLHLRLNREGKADGDPSELPLTYVGGVVACGKSLVATGKNGDDHSVLSLDSSGKTLWQSAIPDVLKHGALTVWPQPLCLNGQPAVAWAAGDQVWLATITNGQCDTPEALTPATPTGELSMTAAGEGVAILQKWQDPARLELVTITAARQVKRQTLDTGDNPSAPMIAFLDDHYLLLWATNGEIRMQAFDRDMKPFAPPVVAAQVERPARPRNARLIIGESGQAALIVTTSRPIVGPPISHGRHAPTSRAPSQEISASVAAYDRQRGTLSAQQPIPNPPVSYEGAGWAADRLIVIGGTEGARLSVFD